VFVVTERRDLGAAPFFMAAMVHGRNGEPYAAFGSYFGGKAAKLVFGKPLFNWLLSYRYGFTPL
jgi:hypothetical protein